MKPKEYVIRGQMNILRRWRKNGKIILHLGDCMEMLAKLPDGCVDLMITSPPYCIGKSYENERHSEDFEKNLATVFPEIERVVKPGGSICWQVGYHVTSSEIVPLDYLIFQQAAKSDKLALRNRIIWTFGHGLHASTRFSGRHETILWFTKGDKYIFNLDSIRIPQLYPGKRAFKGSKKGSPSGNPLGKNPSDVWTIEPTDVWQIPNVKAGHIEKTEHPCQFPIALATRLISGLSNEGDWVLDPYVGAGTTAAAAVALKRRFVGAELKPSYHSIAENRIRKAANNILPFRPDGKPVYEPKANTPLTTVPKEWRTAEQG
jgi:adenine-specific DNA-methyltransferase